jgi:hypothetical protein
VLYVKFFLTIDGSVRDIGEHLIESFALNELDYANDSQGEYDLKAEGMIYGILHPFPSSNLFGDTMTYEFSADAQVFGQMDNGEYAGDDFNDILATQTLSLAYTNPIDIQ